MAQGQMCDICKVPDLTVEPCPNCRRRWCWSCQMAAMDAGRPCCMSLFDTTAEEVTR